MVATAPMRTELLPDTWISDVTENKYDFRTSLDCRQWGGLSWPAYKDDCMGCVKCDCHARKETKFRNITLGIPFFTRITPKSRILSEMTCATTNLKEIWERLWQIFYVTTLNTWISWCVTKWTHQECRNLVMRFPQQFDIEPMRFGKANQSSSDQNNIKMSESNTAGWWYP